MDLGHLLEEFRPELGGVELVYIEKPGNMIALYITGLDSAPVVSHEPLRMNVN